MRNSPCHNTKNKLKSREDGGKRHSSSDHNPFAKWKTLRTWEGREGRWTESTDDGPASEKDGTCVIMGDRRLSGDRVATPGDGRVSKVLSSVVVKVATPTCSHDKAGFTEVADHRSRFVNDLDRPTGSGGT